MAQHRITIHGVTYDISNFDHPGGRVWLKCVAGQDATVHFEAHHLRIGRARARLATLPVVYSHGVSFSEWDWSETGFHATVRRRAAAALLDKSGQPSSSESDVNNIPRETWCRATSSTLAMRVTRVFAIALWMAAFAATCVTRSPWMAMACGVMTAVMGGFGHNALHQRGESWDCWLFECAGMSHEEYRTGPHTDHHMRPNLPEDPDAFGMSPVVDWAPPADGSRSVRRMLLKPLVFHIVAALAVPFTLVSYLTPSFYRRDFRQNAGVVVPLLELCMLVVSGWLWSLASHWFLHSIGLWLLVWTFGSFYFMLVTNVTHNQERNWMASSLDIKDWGAWQMATATDISIPCGLRGVPLCAMMLIFLHEQTLHHLFPSIDHSRLHCLRPMVQRTAEEFGLTLHKPRNYLCGYIGMVAALAGISESEVRQSEYSFLKG